MKFKAEVETVLRDQAKVGQVVIMAEPEARRKYGGRLTMAALSALEKSTSEDGLVEVRVLHDGTNGVDLNRFILVKDGGISPMAADMKTALRHQAARQRPYWGLTADIKSAHRLVAVRPEDWPLIACQLEAGGEVFLNTVGTFG